MEEKRKKTFDLTKLKKENYVVIFLIGILLLVIAWPIEDKKTKQGEDESGITDIRNGTIEIAEEEGITMTGTDLQSNAALQSYTESLEQTLEELLSAMEGAGQVKVMITLKSSGESIIEKDTGSSKTSSTEVDSAGGSRNSADVSETEETIYINSGSGIETPFVKQILYPQIEGVVVCAEGGGNDTVNKNITEAIQALFGIDVHKIKVIKMSSK